LPKGWNAGLDVVAHHAGEGEAGKLLADADHVNHSGQWVGSMARMLQPVALDNRID
jgi:hypothetical protein